MDTMPDKTTRLTIIVTAMVDTDCPNDKKYAYEFCDVYSLGYTTKWHSLCGDTTTTAKLRARLTATLMCALMQPE